MATERTVEGFQLTLKSRGAGRYLSGAFLAFWLCGWAVGEVIVLWILVKGAIALLTGRPPDPGREPLELGPALMVGVFLLLWVTLWTFGGVAAIAELLRLLWGEDRIQGSRGRLTATWVRGPFRRARVFERDAIRGITLAGRQARLVLQSRRERIELSGLGSREERLEGAAGLRAELGLADAATATAANGSALPGEWEVVITPEGERAVVPNPRTRRIQARIAALVALGLAAVTFLLARESIRRIDLLIPTFICLVFTVGAAAGALWLARGRWEWRIGHGRLTRRKRYGSSVRDEFEGRHLMLECTNDSDGDSWYELHALAEAGKPTIPAAIQWRSITPKNSRTVARVMDDDASVRELAAFLSRETGLELEDRTTPQARALEVAELLAMLESSGTFGRWAAKMVERLGPAKGRE